MDKALSDNEELWKQLKILVRIKCQKVNFQEKSPLKIGKNLFEKLHSETREQSIPLIAENKHSKSLNKPFKMKELLSVIKK